MYDIVKDAEAVAHAAFLAHDQTMMDLLTSTRAQCARFEMPGAMGFIVAREIVTYVEFLTTPMVVTNRG